MLPQHGGFIDNLHFLCSFHTPFWLAYLNGAPKNSLISSFAALDELAPSIDWTSMSTSVPFVSTDLGSFDTSDIHIFWLDAIIVKNK